MFLRCCYSNFTFGWYMLSPGYKVDAHIWRCGWSLVNKLPVCPQKNGRLFCRWTLTAIRRHLKPACAIGLRSFGTVVAYVTSDFLPESRFLNAELRDSDIRHLTTGGRFDVFPFASSDLSWFRLHFMCLTATCILTFFLQHMYTDPSLNLRLFC